VFDAFFDCTSHAREHVRFLFDGQRLQGADTPSKLDMETEGENLIEAEEM
jgi:hypothetical protein